ncbi:MAG: ribose-phosphate diphosphokinase [Candidatus Helarchaeota archaeon]|nr:ribose-phosphate diphosphokinase [Candidatus Helarchaeota archaeon]
MIVVPGPASQKLGIEIGNLLPKADIAPIKFKDFPDGEIYVRIDKKVKGEHVIIVQSTYPPQDYHLMQLYQLIDAARNSEAKKITTFIPYLAYSRQDKKFLDGEPLTSRIVCKTIENLGVDEVYVLDIHSKLVLKFFTIPVHNLLALDLFCNYFNQISLSNPLIVAPDEGALEKAQIAAKALNCGCTYITKTRDRHTGEITVTLKNMDVANRDLIILDDIISTGGTMAKAIQMAKRQGANKIYAVCSHPLLIQNAKERILEAGATDIIGTNSVDSEFAQISLASLFVKEFTE